MMAYDVDSGNLKMAENFYLRRACEDRSMDALMQFSAFRRARGRIMGEGAMLRESAWESVDGLAEYIRLMGVAADDRGQFLEEVGQHLQALCKPENFLKPELISASVGVIICLALKNLNIDFPVKFEEGESIFSFVPKVKNDLEKLLEGED